MTHRTLTAATLAAAIFAVGATQPVLAAVPFDSPAIESVQDHEIDKFKFKKFKFKKGFKKKKFFYGY